MPSKRKRGEVESQDRSTLEHTKSGDSKKQKKSHKEAVDSKDERNALEEPPALETVAAKPGIEHGTLKLARRFAKKERRKLQRQQNRVQPMESTLTNRKLQVQDDKVESKEQDLPTPSEKAMTADGPTSSPEKDRGADKKTRKVAKQEKRRLEKESGHTKTPKTEGAEGEDHGKVSIEREASKKEKRKEERQKKKAASPSEKPTGIPQNGESPTLNESEKTGTEILMKSDEKAVSKKQKKKREKKQVAGQEELESQVQDPAWKVSDPVGGHMVDIDPVFSTDEKFLLVAYPSSIVVYSTSTSLQVRQLETRKAGPISTFALSVSAPDQLYLATYTGSIERWDWKENVKLGSWKLSSSIHSLATSSPSEDRIGPDQAANGKSQTLVSENALVAQKGAVSDNVTKDLVYTVDKKDQDLWRLSAHRLAGEKEVAATDVITLHKNKDPVSSFKVIEGGQVIVATSGRQLIIGTTTTPGPSNLRELSYIWRILECPEWISSIDVRMRLVGNLDVQAKKKGLLRDSLDVVVGGLGGSIHIYEDVLKKLFRREQAASKNSAMEDIISRRLHWHRSSVLAVKWSLDGNYIISGGQETVLVIWQLETGQKQDLPHLGSPIESIVVSPIGSSYSVRLADNSSMILSTSELRPTFSIAGIQIPIMRTSNDTELPFVPTVNTPYPVPNKLLGSPLPACISSSAGGYLLLAVPPSVTSRQATARSRNSSYLQTFDTGGGHQMSRQALTRTNITTLNMGPESNTIEEPNVINIQTSNDGQWLASIDEWMSPKRDVAPLSFDQDRAAEEQIFRREIYLKFWSWNDNAKVWELVSRVDNPHPSQSGNPYEEGRVLGLASDPSTAGFATISGDGLVRTWKPAIRRRNGLEVRNKDGKSLAAWHCKHITPLESAGPTVPNSILGAKLAYSQDGSIIAAGLQSSLPCPIYLLDSHSGNIKSVQTGLYSGPLYGLGIVNKYLITLSHELCVWDLITEQREWGIQLHRDGLTPAKRLDTTLLAVDARDGLFAVAIPQNRIGVSGATTVKSRVAIFDPINPVPSLLTALPNPVTNLLSATKKKAFYAIDSVAEIRTLAPVQGGISLPKFLAAESEEAPRGLGEIFGKGEGTMALDEGLDTIPGPLGSKFESVTRESRRHEDDMVVISQDKLAEVFDVGPAYAMPPVIQLFEQVASLYNGASA